MKPQVRTMKVEPLAGVRVVAVFCAGNGRWTSVPGVVAGDGAVLLNGTPPESTGVQRTLLFTRVADGQNMWSEGAVSGMRLGQVVVRVVKHWQPADQRSHPRFRVAAPAWLGVPGSRASLTQGRVVDISLGGAAVEIEDAPESDDLVLSVDYEGMGGSIPARVVSVTPGDEGRVVVHLQFRTELEAYQAAFVRSLVMAAAESHGWIRG